MTKNRAKTLNQKKKLLPRHNRLHKSQNYKFMKTKAKSKTMYQKKSKKDQNNYNRRDPVEQI